MSAENVSFRLRGPKAVIPAGSRYPDAMDGFANVKYILVNWIPALTLAPALFYYSTSYAYPAGMPRRFFQPNYSSKNGWYK